MNVLLVSNGYGESAIAGYLGGAILAQSPRSTVEHLPLVGSHESAQSGNAIPAVGPNADMPSGGLIAYWNLPNLARDVGAGLLSLSARQFSFLSRQRERDVVVAVGDVFCCAACLLFARRPTVFVATAKSELVAPHSALERAIARRAKITFARDAATARALAQRGVHAHYEGNLMMDGIGAHEVELPLSADAVHVGVLPGSRRDAPANASAAIRRLRTVADLLSPRAVQAFVSVAPSASEAALLAASASAGVALSPTGARKGVVARGADGSLDVALVAGGFGDLLRASDIVLGQSGTGNEQAAGLGKPVVASAAAADRGRVGWYRMRQQRLLGDALLVLPDDDVTFAADVAALLRDPQRLQAMGATGIQRMGKPGGAEAVAKAVLALASETRG